MDMQSATNSAKEEYLQVEETDDSCRFKITDVVSLTRDADGSCTTECVSGEWSAEVIQEDIKQEPDDVIEYSCYQITTEFCGSLDDESSAMCSVNNDAVPADVDETQSHMKPVVVLEKLDLARLQMKYNISIDTGDCCAGEKTEADSHDITDCAQSNMQPADVLETLFLSRGHPENSLQANNNLIKSLPFTHKVGYPRRCPRPSADGRQCDYIASSDRSFRRHLIIHHAERWASRRRGPRPHEQFIPMTAREAYECRVALGSRQGGRALYRRKLIDEARRRQDIQMPLPPPPAHSQRRHFDRQRPPSARPLRPVLPYPPAGQRSGSAEPASSLSDGGHTANDRDELSDVQPARARYIYLPDVVQVLCVGATHPDEAEPPRRAASILDSPADDCRDQPAAATMEVSPDRTATSEAASEAPTEAATYNSRGSSARARRHQDVTDSATAADQPAQSLCRSTTDRGAQAVVSTTESATDPPPSRASSVYHSRDAQTTVVSTSDAATETAPPPQPVTMSRDASSWTGPMPRPWLRHPNIATRDLARLAARLGREHLTSSVDRLADRITAAAQVGDASQRRVVQLMAEYGGELLRLSAERLLENIEVRFGHLNEVPLRQIITYAVDELGVWSRRPSLPRQSTGDNDADAEFDWFH